MKRFLIDTRRLDQTLARSPAGRVVLVFALGGLTMSAINSVRRVVELGELLEKTKPHVNWRASLRWRRKTAETEDVVPDGGRDASVDDEPYAAPPG